MRSRSPCSEGNAASQSKSESEGEGSRSDSSGGRSKKKWTRRKRRGGTGSSPKNNKEARTGHEYMRLMAGFESDEQPTTYDDLYGDEDENDPMSGTNDD
eukprot:7284792-Prymnesium_polylepis.1